MNLEENKAKVTKALNSLLSKDTDLLWLGVHERSVAHKFAEYLQDEYKVHNVDCEYNRDGLETKILETLIEDTNEKEPHRIFPDIIVHRRGNNNFNQLVIEIKTSNASSKGDIEKLEKLTQRKHGFHYKYGLFLRFECNDDKSISTSEVSWYTEGKEINNSLETLTANKLVEIITNAPNQKVPQTENINLLPIWVIYKKQKLDIKVMFFQKTIKYQMSERSDKT